MYSLTLNRAPNNLLFFFLIAEGGGGGGLRVCMNESNVHISNFSSSDLETFGRPCVPVPGCVRALYPWLINSQSHVFVFM